MSSTEEKINEAIEAALKDKDGVQRMIKEREEELGAMRKRSRQLERELLRLRTFVESESEDFMGYSP